MRHLELSWRMANGMARIMVVDDEKDTAGLLRQKIREIVSGAQGPAIC